MGGRKEGWMDGWRGGIKDPACAVDLSLLRSLPPSFSSLRIPLYFTSNVYSCVCLVVLGEPNGCCVKYPASLFAYLIAPLLFSFLLFSLLFFFVFPYLFLSGSLSGKIDEECAGRLHT